MKNRIIEEIILPFCDILVSQSVMKSYGFYRDSMSWSVDCIANYQNVKLRELILFSRSNTKFYRDLYDRLDLSLIRGKEDLVRLPITNKKMFRECNPDDYTPDKIKSWTELYTSGSSGQPFCVRQDREALSESRALMLLRANFSGWKIGDPYLQTGMTLNRGIVKKVKDLLLGVVYISAFDLRDSSLDSILQLLLRKRIKYVMGYASSLYCLANRAFDLGFDYELNGVVSWGDNMFDHYRRKIESSFGCRVTDTYGCGEGIQVAAQCSLGKYHIFSPHVIVEIVDENGMPVENGKLGDILLTKLTPGAMPFIRYKVGDIGALSERCDCGCNFETLASIDGRNTDVVITHNGNRLIVHFFTGIFEYETAIKEFQVIQERIGHLLINIVSADGFTDKVLLNLENEIVAKAGGGVEVDFNVVENIPLEKTGKRRFIISNIGS
jgi:phenylacetate-CoA ligase